MKYLNKKEFDLLNVELRESEIRDLKEDENKVSEINKIYPCELFYYVDIYEHNNKIVNEYRTTLMILKHESLTITISYNKSKKKYNISNHLDTQNFKLSYSEKITIDNIEQPKKIGVLNEKKIKDWINYLERVYKVSKEFNNKNDNHINSFLNTIKDLPIQWDYDNKGGYHTKNGLTFSFKIKNTYITTKIEIDAFQAKDLESFLNQEFFYSV